jgi:hypothetical protein
MDHAEALPPRWRVVAAFLVAPFMAALAMAWIEPLYAGIPNLAERVGKTLIWYCLIGAYPTTLVFGVPLFLALRRRVPATALNCILAGGVVAACRWIILLILPPPAGSGAIDGGQVTILNGQRTLAGWLYGAQSVAEVAGSGLLAGLVFWIVAKRFRPAVRSA